MHTFSEMLRCAIAPDKVQITTKEFAVETLRCVSVRNFFVMTSRSGTTKDLPGVTLNWLLVLDFQQITTISV